MKKIIVSILMVLSVVAQAAPTLPQTTSVSLPKLLLKNTVKQSEVDALLNSNDWGQSSNSGKFWTVYSDRDNNMTYNSASSTSGVCTTLSFNEKLRIAKIENGYALVYEEKEKGLGYPHISKTSAESKGWIPMDHLLLWGSCPTNEAGIYNKALIVLNLDEIDSNTKSDMGNLYLNPSNRNNSTKLTSSMDFYFVMKKDKASGLVLLARECKMEGYTSEVLFGWVHQNSFVSWDQRTCLEQNWKPNVAEQLSGQEVPVFKDAQLTKFACRYPLGTPNSVATTKSIMYRMNPDEMRYPVLNNDSGNESLYKITAFATTKGGTPPRVPRGKGNNSITEDKLRKMSVINLIVVIDGTSSMENYYKPTQEIIKRAYDYFGKESGNVVKVGVVIYRDYSDGQYIIEKVPMTSPTDPKILKFLETGGSYGVKSSPNDHTYAEALYKGLEVALDADGMGYSAENSNLMFVVGDCGNDLEDTNCISEEEIIRRCVKNRVQVSAFQVRNNNEQSFLLFRQQMGKIVRENLKAQYGKLGNDFKAGFKELSDGYEFKTSLPPHENFYIGSTRNADLGMSMDVSKLYDIVKNSYMQFSEAIDAQRAIVYNSKTILNGGGNGSKGTVDGNLLKTIFTTEEINILMSHNNLMAVQGYTNKKTQTGLDYWQPIIYISSDEFAGLMEKLQPVMAAASSGSTDRKPYVSAMKALIRSMVPDITEREMDEKDVKEVMALVSGLNVTSQSLGGRSLIQIQDENIVPLAEFDAMIAEFRNKYNKLKKIREQNYLFSTQSNKTTWYWIPVEDLP